MVPNEEVAREAATMGIVIAVTAEAQARAERVARAAKRESLAHAAATPTHAVCPRHRC